MHGSDAKKLNVEVAVGPTSLHVSGTFADLFFAQLTFLLVNQPVLRVRQCQECDTFFYCRKDQVYCTRNCSNRAAQRRFRERQEAATAS